MLDTVVSFTLSEALAVAAAVGLFLGLLSAAALAAKPGSPITAISAVCSPVGGYLNAWWLERTCQAPPAGAATSSACSPAAHTDKHTSQPKVCKHKVRNQHRDRHDGARSAEGKASECMMHC